MKSVIHLEFVVDTDDYQELNKLKDDIVGVITDAVEEDILPEMSIRTAGLRLEEEI